VTEPVDLALRFAADHPEGAARIVQSLPPAEAAAFLGACPAIVAARLLELLAPAVAGQALKAMSRAAVGERLSVAAVRPAAIALRTLDAVEADALLDACDTSAARRIRRHLALPEHAVAAWADQDYIAFGPRTTAAEALETLRATGAGVSGVVFVIAEQRRYQGLLTIADLVRLGLGANLTRHRRRVPALLDRTPLQAARGRPEWDELGALPVVDRQDRLIGALTRAALGRGLAQTTGVGHTAPSGDMVMAISSAYYDGMSGMLRTVLGSGAAVQKEDGDDG